MIKVISLDIGGTLLEYKNDNGSQYNLKELTRLINLPYETVRDVYKEIFQTKKGTLNELINMFCKKLEIKNFPELNNFFIKKFQVKQEETISLENIALINDLKESGYKVILFSNSCCLLNNDAINEIVDSVDNIFYSYDMGFTKDDSESYKYIEKVLNVMPNEILHIGDTLKSDYYMPIENGWNALYYGENDNPDIESISSLKELYGLLGIMRKNR